MQQNMQPRAPPSPSPSQTGSQYNGNGAQQNGIPMVNGLPSGGQQTDMNHLWAVVQQLSQVLEDNKQQTAGIVNGVNAVRARAAEESGAVNGNGGFRQVNGELDAATRHAEIAHLQSQLTSTQTHLSTLSSSNTALQSLLTDYENALTLLLDKLRPYAYNQTSSILALHKHYQKLLEEERGVSMQLRLEHAEWQAGLGRVADYARTALKSQGESEEGLRREIRGLKEENRVLRGLCGWEDREDDEKDS
ncbi:hypothetical protein CC86DRAFT_301469 [Ophiobolus disseminans]|uniref:Uncharacterized protein n=1 Tax=Ophiobolus disseminans TaxID=1469910 RepID=A0A6A6ZPH2_9PLEO|nr:hypothetical protein CC86DRAFT_301469 [Ophiobolus disseminans]